MCINGNNDTNERDSLLKKSIFLKIVALRGGATNEWLDCISKIP